MLGKYIVDWHAKKSYGINIYLNFSCLYSGPPKKLAFTVSITKQLNVFIQNLNLRGEAANLAKL